MEHIFVYGDSLTWGIVPGTRRRLPFEHRWPIVMEAELAAAGRRVRVIEDALNGRRTVWEDPFKAGRRGLAGLEQRIEVNSPLSLVLLMLGTNDFQSMYDHNAWHAAQGVATLVQAVRSAPIEPDMPVPGGAVIAPPLPRAARGEMAGKFAGAERRSVGLTDAYRQMAADLGCRFFDASSVVTTSPVDGVHLDADQHAALGKALAPAVCGWLPVR
jgi:lysophospholipase L1-like esterase